jgi:hypothetical protein
LFLSFVVAEPAVSRQDSALFSHAQTTAYQENLTRPEIKKTKPSFRRRTELSREHERLLSRDPKQIIPDICVGCFEGDEGRKVL